MSEKQKKQPQPPDDGKKLKDVPADLTISTHNLIPSRRQFTKEDKEKFIRKFKIRKKQQEKEDL